MVRVIGIAKRDAGTAQNHCVLSALMNLVYITLKIKLPIKIVSISKEDITENTAPIIE